MLYICVLLAGQASPCPHISSTTHLMKEMITDKAVGTFGLFNESFPPIMDGVAVAVRNYAYWLYEAV